MLTPDRFYASLSSRGISLFTGVPDSLLKDFCAYVTDNTPRERNIITANEGSAVAIAMGHYLATGKIGLVYMQNSGLGNAVNPLTSLADPKVYGVPLLLMIGWRGMPGEKDEPQHVKMGAVTLETLAAIGVPHTILPDDPAAADAALDAAIADAKTRQGAHALVVKKGTFDAYKLKSAAATPYEMTREGAIEQVVAALPANVSIVATTGMPSRELFEVRERRKEAHESDFLTVGGMGHASQIALGVALERADRPVLCLDGDGAVIMHMGCLATIGELAPKNFKHVVLNNGAHDSVGGQPTAGFGIDICAIARQCGYTFAERADDAPSAERALQRLFATEGPALVEIRVKKGSRKDLGRPTMSPADLKVAFSAYLTRK